PSDNQTVKPKYIDLENHCCHKTCYFHSFQQLNFCEHFVVVVDRQGEIVACKVNADTIVIHSPYSINLSPLSRP
uniref:Uncharacterized protein n=1 Tax=Petromyzon marinus TaxID=7757 RepID=S4RKQ6_PETMA